MKKLFTYFLVIAMSCTSLLGTTPKSATMVNHESKEQEKKFSTEAKDEFFSYLKDFHQKHIDIKEALLDLQKDFDLASQESSKKAENIFSTKWKEIINNSFDLKFKNPETKILAIKFIKEFNKILLSKNMYFSTYVITIDTIYDDYLKAFTKEHLSEPYISTFDTIDTNRQKELIDKIKKQKPINTSYELLLDFFNYSKLNEINSNQLQKFINKYINNKSEYLAKSQNSLDQQLSQSLNKINIDNKLEKISTFIDKTSEEELYQIIFEDDEEAKKLRLNFFDMLLKNNQIKTN